MLNLNQLRIFHMAAKHKNVNTAAKLLFISQPAISNGLRRFQQEIELKLFEKRGRHLILTPVGERLAEFTNKLFNVENDIEQYISEVNKKRAGIIRMGVATLYERFAMVDLMSSFDISDSNTTISVTSGNSRDLVRRLNEGEVDLVIAGDMDIAENIQMEFIKKHQIYLVAPQDHKLYGQTTFHLSDLAGESMVMKEEGSAVRRSVNAYLKENAIAFDITAELSNLDSIFDVIIKEKCLTFLPDMALDLIESYNLPLTISSPVNGEISFSIYLITLNETIYPRWLWEKIRNFAKNICHDTLNF